MASHNSKAYKKREDFMSAYINTPLKPKVAKNMSWHV